MKITTININISGREYPVNVTPDTEALMEQAAATVNEQVKSYSSSYAISDARDLLAMCALQLAFQNLEKEQSEKQNIQRLDKKISAIETVLSKT